MHYRSPTVIVDPLAFSLRSRGGVARVWENLLPRLVASDLNVQFTCGGEGKEIFKDGLQGAIRYFNEAYRIPAGIRRFVPFTQRDGIFFPTYFRPCLKGTRNVQVVHDCMKELYYSLGKTVLARIRRKSIYENATTIVAISEMTRLDLVRLHGGAIEDRVRVIYNPVDFAHIIRCSEAAPLSDDFSRMKGWIDGRPYALFIGHRGGWKNFREVRHLLTALPEHVVVAVGATPTTEEERLATDLGNRIFFAGPAPDELMFRLLKGSDFLFWPSILEGFGLPVVESLFLGTPVLALDTQVNHEVSLGLITQFESGSPASIRAAVSAMKRIEPDDPVRARLIARYDPQTIANAYIRVLKDLF